jgi:hypothetical protein
MNGGIKLRVLGFRVHKLPWLLYLFSLNKMCGRYNLTQFSKALLVASFVLCCVVVWCGVGFGSSKHSISYNLGSLRWEVFIYL